MEMRIIKLSVCDRGAIDRARALAETWCSEHPRLLTGVAEMALGAALLAWGVHHGAIEMGIQVLGTATDITNPGGATGGAVGLAVGAVAAKIIGSIGVVGMGSGIGIPVGLLALGGGALLSAAGYTAGDIAYGLLNKVDLADLALGASAMGIGLALLIDGARRVVGDDAVRQGAARVTAAAIELFRANATVVARSVAELAPYERDAAALGLAALAGWGGAAAGGAYAATSVTVLGSSTLGSLALGMGLVAAPVWPMVLGAAAAAVGGGLLARRILRSRRE